MCLILTTDVPAQADGCFWAQEESVSRCHLFQVGIGAADCGQRCLKVIVHTLYVADQFTALAPDGLMASDFVRIEIEKALSRHLEPLEKVVCLRRHEECKEAVGLLIPGLSSEPQHVVVDEVTPKELHQHYNARG